MPDSENRTFTQLQTFGGGNSGPNAFILSLVTPTKFAEIEAHFNFLYPGPDPDITIDEHFAEFIKGVAKVARAHPIKNELGSREILTWQQATQYLLDLRKQDPEILQTALAPFIRHFVNVRARTEKYYEQTLEPLKRSFLRVFNNPSILDDLDKIDELRESGDADDVFITHRFIAEKFKAFLEDNALSTLSEKIEGIRDSKGNLLVSGLLDWWDSNGFIGFHDEMAAEVDPHWFSQLDFRILADYFFVNVDIENGYSHQRQNIVTNANGMVGRDQFSDEMISQLVARKIIAKPDDDDDFLFFLKMGENDADAKKKVKALVDYVSPDQITDYVFDFEKTLDATGLPVNTGLPKNRNYDDIIKILVEVGLIAEKNGYYVYLVKNKDEAFTKFDEACKRYGKKLITEDVIINFIMAMNGVARNLSILDSVLPPQFASDDNLVEQLLQRSIIVEKNGEYVFNKSKEKIYTLLERAGSKEEVTEFIKLYNEHYHQAPTVSLYNSDHLHFTSRVTVAEAKQLNEKPHKANETQLTANKNTLFSQTRNSVKPDNYEMELNRIILARNNLIEKSRQPGKQDHLVGYFLYEKFEGKNKIPDFYVSKPVAEQLDRLLAQQKQLEDLIEDKKLTESESNKPGNSS